MANRACIAAGMARTLTALTIRCVSSPVQSYPVNIIFYRVIWRFQRARSTQAGGFSSTMGRALLPTRCACLRSSMRPTGTRLCSKTCGLPMVASLLFWVWVIRELIFTISLIHVSRPMSNSNRTGYGQHGDYLFGWEDDSLQRAMNTCLDDFGSPELCTELTIQTDEEINKCIEQVQVNEKTEGERKFPGFLLITVWPSSDKYT